MNQAIDAPLEAIGQLIESRSDSLLGLGMVGVLAAARIAGLVFTLPGWQSGVFPVRLRLAGVLVVTWLVVPMLSGAELSGLDGPTVVGRALIEAIIGAVLGLGVVAVLAGLRGAGEIIDRQTGWGLAGVLDPSGSGGGPGTTLVTWAAVAALFVMTPINGHLLLVDSLLGTVVIGMVGRALPETNVLVAAMPARVLVGVMLLSMVVTGAGRVMTDAVPGMLYEVTSTLVEVTAR
jgi:flagellar biosynthesis protein FliR